ncbi:MAG: hypothetical protein P8090_01385 [Gammaproteobacteria bacterium]
MTRRRRSCMISRGLLLVALAAPAAPSAGIERLSLHVAGITGNGWQAKGIDLSIGLSSADSLSIQASIKRLELPQPLGTQHDVTVRCPRAHLQGRVITCADGEARLPLPQLARARIPIAVRYDLARRTARLQLKSVAVAGGTLAVTVVLDRSDWHMRLEAPRLQVAQLAKLLQATTVWPKGYSASGTLALSAEIAGSGTRTARVQVRTRLTGLGFSSPDGVNAGEKLGLTARIDARRQRDGWDLNADSEASGGILCVSTCWQLPQSPLRSAWRGHWSPATRRLQLTAFSAGQPGVVQVHGSADLQLGSAPRLDALQADVAVARLDAAYKTYLQPLLLDGNLGDLAVRGSVRARLRYHRDGTAAFGLQLRQVQVDDHKGRFGVSGLDGMLHWSAAGTPAPSQLSWRDAHLYDIPVGGSRLEMQLGPRALRLLQPTSIPVFDGALKVDRFSLQQLGTPALQVGFDGLLTPVSMDSLSRALGWPAMSGKLSGVIPDVTYEAGGIKVGGVLLVRAFDGDITIRNLRLERLFGVAPLLYADVVLKNLDLDILTRTFSFGTIEGRLDGAIEHLSMVDWQPVAFDARFATPENDQSRHRISQTAVNNLTNLGGGGVGGALSRGFLSFFHQFSYSRLGIRCRLKDGVCDMGGVAPAPNGYYIVKGGGLPRIDVIGYARRVDWDELVQRLKTITSSAGPVVK